MNPIKNEETSKAVTKLKYNGKGSKTISTLVLKDNKNRISEILTHILNICVTAGYFPNELKTGCITPIYKNGSKSDIKNYRPVSLYQLLAEYLKK